MAERWGKCRLCREERRLLESHVIPRWVYKMFHRVCGPTAWNYDRARGVRPKSPKQMKEHMLCAECEARMKVGDDYFKEIAYRDNEADPRDRPCPLFRMAGYTSPLSPEASSFVQSLRPHQATIRDLKVDLVQYFALSVFWRAAQCSTQSRYTLPEPWQESLRVYLLAGDGERPGFIASVWMMILDQPRRMELESEQTISTPHTYTNPQPVLLPRTRVNTFTWDSRSCQVEHELLTWDMHSFQAAGLTFRILLIPDARQRGHFVPGITTEFRTWHQMGEGLGMLRALAPHLEHNRQRNS